MAMMHDYAVSIGHYKKCFAQGYALGSLSMTNYLLGLQSPPARPTAGSDSTWMPTSTPPRQSDI